MRFKNQGLDSIEVQDNGSGISRENYETLALKHYTSKLSSYEDLTRLQTFGFRGEALSSLCALSKFSVTTCLASEAPKGSRLEFETSGKLKSTGVVAAQKGTTISIDGLFKNLPVRRRELERNIKREWNRVIGVLNQYACILTGVKFTVSQQPNKGKKIILFSTKGNATTRDNIVNVFGAKTLSVLIPLQLQLALEPTSAPSQLKSTREEEKAKEIHVRGHVSRPAHGEGRQTPDRQMFFVNGRPCGLPQFAKVFNEVYKSYNSSQSPFIFADIQLDTDMYDVNVSPDKRTIMLHDQSRMLDNLRESLVALFEAQDYSVPTSSLAAHKTMPFAKLGINRQGTTDPEDKRPRASSAAASSSVLAAGQGVRDSLPEGLSDDENEGTNKEKTERQQSIAKDNTQQGKGSCSDLISQWRRRESIDGTDCRSTTTPQIHTRQVVNSGPREMNSVEGSPARLRDQDKDKDTEESLGSVAESPGKSDVRTRPAHEPGNRNGDGGSSRKEQGLSELPIPSVPNPSRLPQSRCNAFSPSTSMHISPEVATITIGNDTITSALGSPAKRPRLAQSHMQRAGSQRVDGRKNAPLPSFQGRLTRMFAASCMPNESSTEDPEVSVDQDEEISEDEDGAERMELPEESLGRSRSPSEGLFVEDEAEITNVDTGPATALDSDLIQPKSEDDGSGGGNLLAMDSLPAYGDTRQSSSPDPAHDEDNDEDYVDRDEAKKAREEGKVKDMINAAEEAAKACSEETEKRQQYFVKGGAKRKDSTLQLRQTTRLDEKRINEAMQALEERTPSTASGDAALPTENINAADAEEKLSLTISKSDFGRMKIIGQFNLGFILAMRPKDVHMADDAKGTESSTDDELFIIDQHATDEKYNFERLQASTVVQSQRLVQPKTLELTAIEEEVVKENVEALEANGFLVSMDESGYQPVGSRCQLLSLPLSRETTFSLADLEELISLLTDHQSLSANTVPRPSKVRKMFAMRACRSSVMIGKSLSNQQMEKLIRHMGELDKPWNCPHGRPTMRHLCGLGTQSHSAWQEGDGFGIGTRAEPTDWAAYVRTRRDD